MLSKNQIVMINAIYLAIDSGNLSDELSQLLVDSVYQKNNEEYAYLIWLLNRWKYHLRKHKYHLPTPIISLSNSINCNST